MSSDSNSSAQISGEEQEIHSRSSAVDDLDYELHDY